jgi:hypothetical protein
MAQVENVKVLFNHNSTDALKEKLIRERFTGRVVPIAFSDADRAFLETTRITRDQVARIFGIPAYLLDGHTHDISVGFRVEPLYPISTDAPHQNFRCIPKGSDVVVLATGKKEKKFTVEQLARKAKNANAASTLAAKKVTAAHRALAAAERRQLYADRESKTAMTNLLNAVHG